MSNNLIPLPEKLRPSSIDGVIGHDSLLSSKGKLTRIIKNSPLSSFILWGPPGCGKTTIAKVISEQLNIDTFEISAVLSGIKDVREIFQKSENNFSQGK